MSSHALMTSDTMARRWGFAPEWSITSRSKRMSAAVWWFPAGSYRDLEGHADEHTDVISMPIAGHPHHTYFGDGRQKWAGERPPFSMNIVAAAEKSRGMWAAEQPFSYLHVYLLHSMIEEIAADIAEKAYCEVALIDPMCTRDPHVEALCRQLIRELSQPDRCSPLVLDCFGQELVIRLLRQHSNVSGSSSLAVISGPGYRDWRLRRAMEYLETRLGEDVGLHEVADTVNLSTTHLTNLFRQGTGEPPHRWLMRRRFEQACELLAKPHLTITDIATQCGFASSQHLATVMRRRLATTPTAYRRAMLP